MKHYQSLKTGKHTTWTDSAMDLCKQIEKLPEVKRVHAGIIHPGLQRTRHTKVDITILRLSHVIKLKIRGPTDIQEVRIQTKNWTKTVSDIDQIINQRR